MIVLDDEISAPDLDDDCRGRPDAFGVAELCTAARCRRPAGASARRFRGIGPGIQAHRGALSHHRGARHDHHPDSGTPSLSAQEQRPCDALPERCGPAPYRPRVRAAAPGKPLGARAMYLGSTVYRTHGTTRPDTIGTAVS